MIDLTHVDQMKPGGFSRDYSEEENGGFASVTSRRISAASAQYLELLMILRKVVKTFFPKTDEEAQKSNLSKTHRVSNATIEEIKEEFKNWREGLAEALGPAEGADTLLNR